MTRASCCAQARLRETREHAHGLPVVRQLAPVSLNNFVEENA